MSRWEAHETELVLAIRNKLEEPGMSLRKAGTIVGVQGQTISNWAKGTVRVTISADTQHGLAQLLEISPRRVLELHGLDLDSGDATAGGLLRQVA